MARQGSLFEKDMRYEDPTDTSSREFDNLPQLYPFRAMEAIIRDLGTEDFDIRELIELLRLTGELDSHFSDLVRSVRKYVFFIMGDQLQQLQTYRLLLPVCNDPYYADLERKLYNVFGRYQYDDLSYALDPDQVKINRDSVYYKLATMVKLEVNGIVASHGLDPDDGEEAMEGVA